MEASTLNDILRNFAFFIDSAVYGLISLLYKLIIYLANVNVINTDNSLTLSNLISRVYILVGIFMLFKLSFSVIRYIVDPDSFTDKAKGFTSIVKRVIIAVLLLVMVPLIFDKMYYFQELVLKNNVIPNLILGTDESRVDDLESAANDVAFLLFGSFFTINENSYSLSACKPTEEFPLANIIGTKDMVLVNDGACFNAFSDALESDELNSYDLSLTDFFKTAASDDENARDVVDERRFDAFGALVAWHDSNYYGISYHAVVTTLCGGYLVFLLLSFCIDIAARAIKLMFMQILSPIAIISSVDPASSSQDDRLKEWGKECLKIYISLFIRLAVVYFTVILVKVITETVTSSTLYYENFGANDSMNSIVYIFLILGAFQVAKKLPELLEKALGIKFSGELSLNPFKSGALEKGLGLSVGLAAGGAAGLVAGREAGAPIRGVLGGMATGAMKGFGTKPALGMVGDLRRKTYKDMTGNDFKTFNPVSKAFGIGGTRKVEKLKGVINVARGELNKQHTKLNSISHLNADRKIKLSQAGIDPESNAFRELIKAENSIKRYSATLAGLRKQRADMIQNQGKSMNSAEVREINRQIAFALRGETDAKSNFAKLGANLNIRGESDANYVMGKQYIAGLTAEEETREKIGKIEKDISTLEDQKRQMEHFYQVDSSTQQSVDKALASVKELDPVGFEKAMKGEK